MVKNEKFEFSIVGVKWAAEPSAAFMAERSLVGQSAFAHTHTHTWQVEGGLAREEKRELALNPIALCRGDHWHLLINNKCIPEWVERQIKWYSCRVIRRALPPICSRNKNRGRIVNSRWINRPHTEDKGRVIFEKGETATESRRLKNNAGPNRFNYRPRWIRSGGWQNES